MLLIAVRLRRGIHLAAAIALLIGGVWAGSEALAAIHLAAAVASLRGRTVAVDPGHGGIDPGAIGVHGVNEDTIVLAVSLDLAGMLTRAGAHVVLTREGNLRVPGVTSAGPLVRGKLYLRARMAQINASGADVLVSVHANHFSSAVAHGPQTFYNARRAAQSRLLAELMQARLAAASGEAERQVSAHIEHYLLDNARMPAVTVEIGFLSNPREARLLANRSYQSRIAYAMFTALAYWFADRLQPEAPTGTPTLRPHAVG